MVRQRPLFKGVSRGDGVCVTPAEQAQIIRSPYSYAGIRTHFRKCLLPWGQQTFAALGKRQTLRDLSFALACANVKNLVVSISLCTFAESFEGVEMLNYSYKSIIIN